MIKQLTNCPYCKNCPVTLNDSFEVVFSESGSTQACSHLIKVAGRYSQWERTRPGSTRIVGSTEFRWDHTGLGTGDFGEGNEGLNRYLDDLVYSGKSWEFAPAEKFEAEVINAEEMAKDKTGKEYKKWSIDGSAVFALNAQSFLALLPACQEKQNAAWRIRQ